MNLWMGIEYEEDHPQNPRGYAGWSPPAPPITDAFWAGLDEIDGFFLEVTFNEYYSGSPVNAYVSWADAYNAGHIIDWDVSTPGSQVEGWSPYVWVIAANPVPEPASGALLFAGVGMLLAVRRKRE